MLSPKWIVEFLSSLLVAIMPPYVAENPHVYRWRQTIAMLVLALAATQIIHVAMACGLIPHLDSAFAKAVDVQTMQVARDKQFEMLDTHVKTIEVGILEDRLISSMERYCDVSKNPEAKRFAYERIMALLTQYEKEAGKQYSLPTCPQL